MRARLLRLALVICGCLAGVALLAAVELALRVLGLGAGPPGYDPFEGFSASVPLFDPVRGADGETFYRASPARLRRTEPGPEREFRAHKRPGAFRMFVLGGSSAAGFPYPPRYAFAGWLERRLRATLPELELEVVNAALPGYSSRRELVLVREIARHEPDLLVVMSGHNEWAERRFYSRLIEMDPWLFRLRERLFTTRLFNLLSHLAPAARDDAEARVQRLLDEEQSEHEEMFGVFTRRAGGEGFASAQEIAQRDALFALNLEEMARAAQQAGARVALLSLVQNLSGWRPGASSHRAGLAPDAAAAWQALVATGDDAARRGDCASALAAFEQARALDDEYAELHFSIGRCQRELGRLDAAFESFRRASDLDRIPHGAPLHFNELIRQVAERTGSLFVDVFEALRRESGPGLLGDDLFVEFVHPNLRGHQAIGRILAGALRRAGIPRPASQWSEGHDLDPDPAAILAREPELRVREHEAIRFTCAVVRRETCVREQTAILSRLRATTP